MVKKKKKKDFRQRRHLISRGIPVPISGILLIKRNYYIFFCVPECDSLATIVEHCNSFESTNGPRSIFRFTHARTIIVVLRIKKKH